MKKLISLLACVALLGVAGCATGPTAKQQDAFDTLIMLADAGMQTYVMVSVERCKGDPECLDNIGQTYAVYTNCLQAAQTMFNFYASGDTNRSSMVRAMQALTAARMDVTRAILEASRR